MNTIIKNSILYILIAATTSFSKTSIHPTANDFILITPIELAVPPLSSKNELRPFMFAVSKRESNNQHNVVNRYGYLGKYQFSPATLWSLGKKYRVTRDQFLRNEDLQDSAMVEYMRVNSRILEDLIDRFDGSYFKGIYITRSGLLAGAHLIGPFGLKAYFYKSYRVKDKHGNWIRPKIKDANGTSVEEYLIKFSNYNLVF